jgi:DNA excision repair protein ERCC-4
MDVVQSLTAKEATPTSSGILEPEVIELSVSVTPLMKAIQSAILVAMNTCISELKKAAPQLETSQMTLENGLFHAFDFAIKRYVGES